MTIDLDALQSLADDARGWAQGRNGWNAWEHEFGHRVADALEGVIANEATP